MLTKEDLDRKVALALGMRTKKVAAVTSAFIDELCSAVIYHGGFNLIGLGKLLLRLERSAGGKIKHPDRDSTRIRLYFRKSKALKKQIERQLGLREHKYGE